MLLFRKAQHLTLVNLTSMNQLLITAHIRNCITLALWIDEDVCKRRAQAKMHRLAMKKNSQPYLENRCLPNVYKTFSHAIYACELFDDRSSASITLLSHPTKDVAKSRTLHTSKAFFSPGT